MANLSFNIKLDSTDDKNRMLVSKIGRVVIKKLAVKFEGNEILSIDDFNVFCVTENCGKRNLKKRNAMRHGIISNDSFTGNCIKLRIDAKDKSASNNQDNAISAAYGDKFQWWWIQTSFWFLEPDQNFQI